MTEKSKAEKRRFPVHGGVGISLVAIFWPLNWLLEGVRTSWGFFPLWFGYCLTVDALVHYRSGNSLLTRSPLTWAGLFAASAPVWWLFELINLRTQNWLYLGTESFSTLRYALFSTLSFSTVMPAVFGTAELVATWKPLRNLPRGAAFSPTPALLNRLTGAGFLMLIALFAWPDVFFPLLWVSLWCLLEPVNVRIGNRSLLDDLARGDWRNFLALAIGCLICGFFWEMWNFYSYPKWIYRIPYANWLHIFEMPAAGYLGYIPFSLELFAIYHLLTVKFRREKLRSELMPAT